MIGPSGIAAAIAPAMVKSFVALSTVAALTSVAAADDGVATPRDPTTALEISLGATAGSLAIAGTGLALTASNHAPGLDASLMAVGATSLLLTPSMGHLYGAHSLFTPWTLVRGVGLTTVLVGTTALWADAFASGGCLPENTGCSPQRSDRGLYIIGAGAAVMLVGAIVDIASAGAATTHWNNDHQLALAPITLNAQTGSTTTGVGLYGRF